MILDNIKKYINVELDERLKMLPNSILREEDREEILISVKEGLFGYCLDLWGHTYTDDSETLGRNIIKYLFDIDKENFNYYDFRKQYLIYCILVDEYELPKHMTLLKNLDDKIKKLNKQSDFCDEFIMHLKYIGEIFGNIDNDCLEEHEEYMYRIFSLLGKDKNSLNSFEDDFDENKLNEFILLENEIDNAFNNFLEIAKLKLSSVKNISNNTIKLNSDSLFFEWGGNYGDVFDFYEKNLNIPIIVCNGFIEESKYIFNKLNLKIEQIEFWKNVYGPWLEEIEQTLKDFFESQTKINYDQYKYNEKMIEKGFYNSSTPNVGVISRDVGAIFVAGLYNAFYEANQERKAYISNENSFHNGQESLIKIIQEMWLKNSNDFFRISKEYNKVIKKIIMRNLCVINGILYQEFISYKNSECAKKYLMEYRHNINVKRNEKRQNNEREKLKYKDEIINLKDELSKKRNELDKYGFAIFGEKASKKRNLKNQINNLKSKIEENELKLELLSNSMNEINGLFQADYIYTHKYKDGGYIQDRNEVYVKYNKENKVYSIYLKRDDLLIGDMEESFNTLVGSYNRKFYGVIENICLSIDSNNDKEGLFIIILKEIS